MARQPRANSDNTNNLWNHQKTPTSNGLPLLTSDLFVLFLHAESIMDSGIVSLMTERHEWNPRATAPESQTSLTYPQKNAKKRMTLVIETNSQADPP